MAPRQYVRRLLVAAPAVALVAATATACHPPNEQPADPNHEYTLPSYEEPEGHEETTTTSPTTSPTETDVPTGEQDGVENGEQPTGVDGFPQDQTGFEGGQDQFQAPPAG